LRSKLTYPPWNSAKFCVGAKHQYLLPRVNRLKRFQKSCWKFPKVIIGFLKFEIWEYMKNKENSSRNRIKGRITLRNSEIKLKIFKNYHRLSYASSKSWNSKFENNLKINKITHKLVFQVNRLQEIQKFRWKYSKMVKDCPRLVEIWEYFKNKQNSSKIVYKVNWLQEIEKCSRNFSKIIIGSPMLPQRAEIRNLKII
jgi:hypothetical protein